jgi:hypothetical protein
MKLVEVVLDGNHYQYFLPRREEDTAILHTMGVPQKDNWVPPPVFIYEPRHIRGDFYQFGSDLITSPKATAALRHLLEAAGELLPLPYEGEEYTVLNILRTVDCVDTNRTRRFPWRGDRYVLQEVAVQRLRESPSVLFKFPQPSPPGVHVVEGLLDPDQEFRAVASQHDLKGLLFIERWNDQDT